MKKCSSCKTDKEEDCFHNNNFKKDGLASECKECKKNNYIIRRDADDGTLKKKETENRKKRSLRIKQFVYDYLLNHPCVDCGENDPIVLEFDHISDKSESISVMVKNRKTIKSIQQEINKCEVRCSNCHKRRTAKQFGWYKNIVK